MQDPRPDRGEWLMSIAVATASRCNCKKTVVGAVITRDGRIIATGYNGTIVGFPNCIDGGCPRCDDPDAVSGTQLDRCICVHAEQNAVLTAAQFTGGLKGAECWVTTEPCLDCTKTLIQAQVSKVVYWRPYVLPQPESQAVRTKMREHAFTHDQIQFVQWEPSTNVLDIESTYNAICARLAEYVRGQHPPS